MISPATPKLRHNTFPHRLGRVASGRKRVTVPLHRLGDFKDNPTQGSQADAQKADRDRRLPFMPFTERLRL
jgi:hypothetical protein